MRTGNDLTELRRLMRQFVEEREWGKFHAPKNLASALSVEAGELLELFQWLNSGELSELGRAKLEKVRFEIADVMSYLILLADRLDIDIYEAVCDKLKLNQEKYPVDLVRGDFRKYSEYGEGDG